MKVYYAGLEHYDFARVVSKISGVNYALFSVFSFLAKKFGIKASFTRTDGAEVVAHNHEAFKDLIMDSGLFTLMFGRHAGKRTTQFIYEWQDAIVEFIEQTGYKGKVVEVDCQKVLGVNEAWKLRKRLRAQIKNDIINVMHREDGKKGLDKLIDYSDYLAVSVPEARKCKVQHLPQFIQRQAYYIKEKKPEIKIHLLGCTQRSVMELTNFCDSCDSTSWQQINRYGTARVLTHEGLTLVNRDYLEQKTKTLNKEVKKLFGKPDMKKETATYYSNYAFSAITTKLLYSQWTNTQQ